MSATDSDSDRPPVLILGLGNILLQDEGLGVHALELLVERYEVPPAVELLDGGTSGMALIDAMAGRERLLVVDAVDVRAAPGTLVELSDGEVPAYLRTLVSPHEIGLVDVLGVMTVAGEAPAATQLIGMVPSSTELSLDLTDLVAARMDCLVERIVVTLREWGYEIRRLPEHNTPDSAGFAFGFKARQQAHSRAV